MARIELSLTAADDVGRSACQSWAGAVSGSADACLLLDERGTVVATSASCRASLGLPDDIDGTGTTLLSSPIRLLNFLAAGGTLPSWDAERVPPLQALKTGALARGLIRVSVGDVARTYDVISTPLHGGTSLAGSLSFLRRC
ncbi:hypothetical protein [Stackebrandtia soli]|uniref:hypothetical protein n=1 Tax=Stackebrandtia soli TaxID=1892856 RepID=UPI0039EAB0D2